MQEITAKRDASQLQLGIVVAQFNSVITEKLLDGALGAIQKNGGDLDRVLVLRVAGSYEIPLAAQKLASRGDLDAIVCLGCLIRGETPHFDYIAQATSLGIGKVALKYDLPIGFGLLTTETTEQALDRTGRKYGNKGEEATLAAIEMANMSKALSGSED